MKIALNTVSVSPHMVPFALELSKRLLKGDFVYIDRGSPDDPSRAVGVRDKVSSLLRAWHGDETDLKFLRNVDVLLQNIRDFDLMDDRVRHDKMTIYQSERWFKPIEIPFFNISISGFWRMVAPFALRRAFRILALFKSEHFMYLPLGLHAARDMARLCGLLHGDIRCIFRAPRIGFERKAGGQIWAIDGKNDKYCLNKMRMWGYFVFPTEQTNRHGKISDKGCLKILWVGRMLKLKRVEDIINAVRRINSSNIMRRKCTLTIVGDGPDREKLMREAKGATGIAFLGSVPLMKVRELMRSHDIYVFSSNQHEGWGAVVNEALEERMKVIGTTDAGASATILPAECIYDAGDISRLVSLLIASVPDVEIGPWSAESAANVFMTEILK